MNAIWVLVLSVATAATPDAAPGPLSMRAVGQTVERNLADSLTLLDPEVVQPALCADGERVFRAIHEVWGESPEYRWTVVFVVCARDGREAVWTRMTYKRQWDSTLEHPAPAPSGRRKPRVRLLKVEGGAFPASALADLYDFLEVVDFWETPGDGVETDRSLDSYNVRVVGARRGEREHILVGGDLDEIDLPAGVAVLFGAMLQMPDPVEYLAGRRDALHDRLREGDPH